MGSVFTLVVFFAALYGVLRLQNFRWRLLAVAYASSVERPVKAVKKLASIVAIGGARFFTKFPAVRISVCEDGLALRVVPPFSVGAPPLFLPYAEMEVRRTDWYLNSGSFSIRMRRGAGVELIVDDELFSWIQKYTDRCEPEPRVRQDAGV